MEPNHFASPYRSLRRARGHIRFCAQRISEIFAREPTELFTRDGSISGKPCINVFVRLKAPLPEEIGDAAVGATDALRSSLDQAYFGSAVALGNTRLKNTYFPFADNEAEFANVVKGRCADLHPDIADLVKQFGGHPGGDKLLWAFNLCRRGNQHRVLIDVGIEASANQMVIITEPPGDFIFWGPRVGGETDDDILVASVPKEFAIVSIEAKPRIHIGLRDAGTLSGHPLVPSLDAFAGKVESIVMAIEAETNRLLRERSV